MQRARLDGAAKARPASTSSAGATVRRRRPTSSSSCSAPAGPPAALACRRARAPVFVNLEHLSAEPYVERSHGLPSPAARPGEPPSTTWFFFPGFGEATGGLLREPGLLERRRAFGMGDEWLASIGVAARADERRVSLFCYGNDAVPDLLDALAAAPTLLLLAPGTAAEQVAADLGPSLRRGTLRAVRLPLLAQVDFDRLLWSCQLNFVRGEDSFVRAIWAGAPFVWQLYVQYDGAHAAKLDAFLGAIPRRRAARARRRVARRCSRAGTAWAAARSRRRCRSRPCAPPGSRTAPRWRERLAAQDDLVTRLLRFVEAKR